MSHFKFMNEELVPEGSNKPAHEPRTSNDYADLPGDMEHESSVGGLHGGEGAYVAYRRRRRSIGGIYYTGIYSRWHSIGGGGEGGGGGGEVMNYNDRIDSGRSVGVNSE